MQRVFWSCIKQKLNLSFPPHLLPDKYGYSYFWEILQSLANQIVEVYVFIGQNNRIRPFVGLDMVVCRGTISDIFLWGNVQSV